MSKVHVRPGYDQIASSYLDYRLHLKSSKYIQQLLRYLPKKSTILDVGCGVGAPVDDLLLKAGHEVIGIDSSVQQIKLARKNCPGGQFIVSDMANLQTGEYQVQAVVSLYALFHIPRSEHLHILKTLASYLPRRGLLLLSMGDRAFEGDHELLGVPMWSSQYGTEHNSGMIRSAGFKILMDEIDLTGGERHQVILAEKQ